MIAGWLVSAEAFVRMANGIRCHPVSPDLRRGLLWQYEALCRRRGSYYRDLAPLMHPGGVAHAPAAGVGGKRGQDARSERPATGLGRPEPRPIVATNSGDY